mgnify:CR=1 FL=1
MKNLFNGSQFNRLVNKDFGLLKRKYNLEKIDLKVLRNIRHGMDYSLLQDLIELGVYDARELADSIMRLRKQGLIEFTKANENIHEAAFKLTSQGAELWEQINDDYDKATEIMFRGMTEEQIETYGRLSQMVIANIDWTIILWL